jgi:hypothetical protein
MRERVKRNPPSRNDREAAALPLRPAHANASADSPEELRLHEPEFLSLPGRILCTVRDLGTLSVIACFDGAAPFRSSGRKTMRRIAIAATTLLMTSAFALAQSNQPTQPVPQKDNPKVEQDVKNKNKGNVENQNPNDTKAKEQAPKN